MTTYRASHSSNDADLAFSAEYGTAVRVVPADPQERSSSMLHNPLSLVFAEPPQRVFVQAANGQWYAVRAQNE